MNDTYAIPENRAPAGSGGGFNYLVLNGISVTLYRYGGTGQLFVSVNTEDATDARDHVEGEPVICISLNDATLYDRELLDEQARVAPANAQVVERLKADLAYHQTEAARLTREHLDIDTSDDYSVEADTTESYHSGRVAALNDALNLLLGREVKLFSETEEA